MRGKNREPGVFKDVDGNTQRPVITAAQRPHDTGQQGQGPQPDPCQRNVRPVDGPAHADPGHATPLEPGQESPQPFDGKEMLGLHLVRRAMRHAADHDRFAGGAGHGGGQGPAPGNQRQHGSITPVSGNCDHCRRERN